MYVYRSNRIEELVDALASVLRDPPGDPIAAETVVVHSAGMARWLSMQLARRLGIAANLDFPFPATLVGRALDAALGAEPDDEGDPWAPGRLTWEILRLLPAALEEPVFAPLASYVARGDTPAGTIDRRHVLLARRIASVFDRYVTYRPDMILGWETGAEDIEGWQPELWRRLRAGIDRRHFAARARDLFAADTDGTLALRGFPDRVALFGISTLAPLYVDILATLGRHCAIHLFVLCPSQEYWGQVRTKRSIARELRRKPEAEWSPEALHLEEGHPLLAAFGRLGRDFQVVLEGQGAETPYVDAGGDLFLDPGDDTMLRTLQSDILHLRHRGLSTSGSPSEAARRSVALHADRSVRVHACHGAMRQVEVLRDELLTLFDEDPSLEPRDVVVMTTDIERFAPLVEAVFADGDDATVAEPRAGFPRLPFHIADRALREENPVARALTSVLGLAPGRAQASEVLDLLGLDPVRRRFGFSEDDLPVLRDWVRESGIRWGLDAQHRVRHGQPETEQNTWRFGLDRLLLGHVFGGEELRVFAGRRPTAAVAGDDVDRLGRFADLVVTLSTQLNSLRAPRPMGAWVEALGDLLAAMTETDDEGSWATREVRGVLERLGREAEAGEASTQLTLQAVLSLVEERFGDVPRAGGFLGGAITVCALVPMRSIPFRVVCLLGMDDGVFPRASAQLGFDLTTQRPQMGDRSVREDDRYLFLEALLAARDRLIITYTGRDVTDNAVLPPAVPVGELLDVLTESFDPGAEGPAAFVVEHPLQAFSPQVFGVAGEPPTSFDRRLLNGARRLLGQRSPAPAFLSGALPPVADADDSPSVALDTLVRFFQHPTRSLLRERLGVVLAEEDETVADREPLHLAGLERWSLGTDVLGWRLAGLAPDAVAPVLRGAGALPPGTPGECRLDDLNADADLVAREVAAWRTGEEQSFALDVDLGPTVDTRLVGRIAGVFERGLAMHQYGAVHARHRVALWIRHVALHAVAPGPWTSCLVGGVRESGTYRPSVACFGPLAPDPREAAGRAAELLRELVALFREGRRRPLPFFPEASLAYATHVAPAPDDPKARRAGVSAAREAWSGGYLGGGEGEDADLARVFGSVLPLGLDADLPAPLVEGAADFHDLALRVWAPALACEEGGTA